MHRKSELLEIITNKYNIHENKRISFNEIQKTSKKEKIEIKDLLYILEVKYNTAYKLKNGKQKYTKLKFNNHEGIKNRKIIAQGKINKLGISIYKYNKIKNNELDEIKVTDVKTKHIVKLIKLDFKYINKYKNDYYSKEKLQKICKERNITLEHFLKYYNKNQSHYKFNKIAMEQSEKGLRIGENIRISNEFMNENYEEIARCLRNAANKYNKTNGWQIYKEDIIEETIISIYENCGEIVKNFILT